jgi:putative endonuclease
MFYVYFLGLRDGRIYVGHSNNPPRRKGEHDQGKGCRTTGIFGAGEIIYVETHPDRKSAARRERQLKKWSHAKKLALANGDTEALKKLSRCRSQHPDQ